MPSRKFVLLATNAITSADQYLSVQLSTRGHVVCQDVYVASRCSEDKELLRTYLGMQDQDSVTAIFYQDRALSFSLGTACT